MVVVMMTGLLGMIKLDIDALIGVVVIIRRSSKKYLRLVADLLDIKYEYVEVENHIKEMSMVISLSLLCRIL